MPIIFNGQTYNSVEDMPPDAGPQPRGYPAMGPGWPAPIQEPPMLAMAPQIPMPSQPSAMAPMLKNVVDDPDAGRRRLVLVLVAALVLLILAGAAGVVLYALYFFVPR